MKRRFAVVLDASGSMSGIIGQARKLGNQVIAGILKDDKKAEITVITFESGNIDVLASNVNKNFTLDENNYNAGGGTPLYAAVLQAVKTINTKAKDTTFTIITVTDGENTDDHGLLTTLKSETKRLQATDKWTFTYALPPQFVSDFQRLVDVPEGNLLGWTKIEEAANAIVRGVSTSVASGNTSTKTFFKVDANKINLKKLRDITDEVTLVTASKESEISTLVAKKTRKDYVKGTGFYQVTKKERKVQPYKKVLVRNKTTGKVYFDGRQALGFPDDVDIKIEPGNLGDNDVFIESQSTNRIIPRGAMVLIWLDAVAVTV